MCKVSARWCSFILGTSVILGIPNAALAQTPLTWAKVERLRNRVHLIPHGHNARLARVTDVMNIGDALRTAASARAELRFNDGSLARVGEQATFRFTPNTRNFQLSNGTVLLLIPPGRGRTTIQTPNAVTGIQGSALFVRVRCLAELTAEGYCSSPVTLVGALTNNPAGAMRAFNESGSQQQPIYAGEMVVIEGDDITERLEFDLRTFYQTSGLVEGLQLDSPTPPEELSEDLQEVWQEIQDALELQGDFDSRGAAEEVVENPGFIAPVTRVVSDSELDLDNSAVNVFAGFPGFESSPAQAFHNIDVQVATAQSPVTSVSSDILETPENGAASGTDVTNARLGAVLEVEVPSPAPAPVAVSTAPVVRTSLPSSITTTVVSPVETAPIVEPAVPLVSTPALVDTTPSVVSTPAPVDTTPSVVSTPAPVESPEPPVVASTIEAGQIPQRTELPPEEFDWNQTPATNDPEILQSNDLQINEENAPIDPSAPNINVQ